MRRALFLALLLVPSLAAARPITVGVGVGVTQSKVDGESGLDANQTLNLFGRLAFTERLSAQLEIQRIEVEDGSNVDIRTATGLLVRDLGRGSLVPILMAGVGVAEADNGYTTTSALHLELGAGLEYRASGGLTVGAELRVGTRSIEEDSYAYVNDGRPQPGSIALYAPSYLSEGEYRAARLYVGIRF